MTPEIDFALVRAAAVGVIAGAVVATVGLFIRHQRRLKAERSQEHIDRPLCLYSTTDPLNASIIRVSRAKD